MSLSDDLRLHLEKSILRIHVTKTSFATGFVIPGGYIITNAHCLPQLPDPQLLTHDETLISISGLSSKQEEASGYVVFTDPCGDIAVLSPLDCLDFPQPQRSEEFIEAMHPARINLERFLCPQNLPVYFRTVLGKWISGMGFIREPFRPVYWDKIR